MNVRLNCAAASLILTCALPALAAEVASSERVTRELPILIGASFVLENTSGDIDVIGTDDTKVVITAEKNVRALDQAALDEGRDATQLALLGDERLRVVRTIVPPIHSGRWTSGMRYIVRVPRTVHVKIVSASVARIHVAGIRGNLTVKSFNGVVVLDAITGPVIVDSANANIIFNAPPRGLGDTLLSTVNGSIEVHAPPSARFQWVAQTMQGDARTTFAVNGTFVGNTYRGSVNGFGGPTLTTHTFNGSVAVLQNGTKLEAARSVRPERNPVAAEANSQISSASEPKSVQVASVRGFYRLACALCNVEIGEIHGDADITTGAGEVQLGTVFGVCHVMSKGGPLMLGQVIKGLTARTEAGDITVQSAREGGTLTTGGGVIRLMFTGGPTRLQSGGGDILVRQAAGPINAETQSGDISITVDMSSKTERVTAKTAKGNVILNVAPAFSAEIDATVITSDPDRNNFVSDLTGLQVRREQIGGKTKIRATGKVNGGGERVEIYAEDGGIQISTHAGTPVGSVTP
jgi:hypothetical protein